MNETQSVGNPNFAFLTPKLPKIYPHPWPLPRVGGGETGEKTGCDARSLFFHRESHSLRAQ